MNDETKRTAKTIRLNEESYHQARIASVSARKSLGQWLEEAILEKLHREQRFQHNNSLQH
jgi:predicted HicB family RNase H-like nuclease